jgi:hypothetical protein
LEEGFAASGGVCRRVKNTSRIPFAIETSLRARVLEYRYITPSIRRSTPRVRALSRGEDDVVDGDAAETKGKDEGQSMAEGTKNRETEKTRAIRRRSPGVSKIARPVDRPLAQCARRARVTTRSRARIVRSRRSRCHERRHDTLGPIADSKPQAYRPRRPRSREAAGG